MTLINKLIHIANKYTAYNSVNGSLSILIYIADENITLTSLKLIKDILEFTLNIDIML